MSVFTRIIPLNTRSSIKLSTISRKIHTTLLTASNSPLENIRVLDLTRVLAGPYATMLLGDLGAEIIKVEKPNTGDDTRSWGPPFLGTESCYFFSVNRNKKSIVVDIKSDQGVEIIQNLAKNSDVFVENFVPGVLDSKGLDYETLKNIAPNLIYCSLTGYGSDGPYRTRPGYDVLAAGMGGLMGVTGPENGEPCKVGVAMTDLATGLYLHGAVMAALMHRQQVGGGQKIECNLLSTQISTMVNLASSFLNGGIEPKRRGTSHESIVPYRSFPTQDGHIVIGAGNDVAFKELCQTLERPDLTANTLYSSNSLRVKNRDTLEPILSECFKKRTTNQWLQIFKGAKFPYGPINSLKEAFEDEQVVHNKMVQTIEHPTSGNIKLVSPAVRFSECENKIRSAPPVLGQHTSMVLQNILKLEKNQIEKLFKDGVIQ